MSGSSTYVAASRKARGQAATRLALTVLLGLAGCRLVDQRTFEPAPAAPSAATLKQSDLPKLPLLTIPFAIRDANWRPALRDAVQAAEAHKPGLTFAIVTPVPVSASREVQDNFTKQGREDALMVADELQVSGIPPPRIAIGLRGDPGSPPRQVQIYAR